jgi:hypothetical protein
MLLPMASVAPPKPMDKPMDKLRYVMGETLSGSQFVVKVNENETYQQAAEQWVLFNKKILRQQTFAVSMFDNKYSIKEIEPNDSQTVARTGNTSKKLCKLGAKCKFNAKGTCNFFHSSEDVSASTQSASTQSASN